MCAVQIRTYEGIYMQKPNRDGDPAAKRQGMPDDEFAACYPTITEYLVTTAWEDGSPRQPSTITLFLEDGVLKAALNDRANARGLYVAGDALPTVLASLEAHLGSATPGWKRWPGGKRKS